MPCGGFVPVGVNKDFVTPVKKHAMFSMKSFKRSFDLQPHSIAFQAIEQAVPWDISSHKNLEVFDNTMICLVVVARGDGDAMDKLLVVEVRINSRSMKAC